MFSEKINGNEEIVRAIENYDHSVETEEIGKLLCAFVERMMQGGTALVGTVGNDDPEEDGAAERGLSYAYIYAAEMNSMLAIAFTDEDELKKAYCEDYEETTWEELFRTVEADSHFGGVLINGGGKRLIMVKEMLHDTLQILQDLKNE